MGGFLVKRISQSIIVLFGISILIFILMHKMPGGPLSMYEHRPGVTTQQIEQIRISYGLNQPIWIQYLDWCRHAVRGDFGYSYTYGRPALSMMLGRLPATLTLMIPAFLLSIVLSISIGTLSAKFQYSKFDYSATFFSYFGVSMPNFWLGTMVLLVFAVKFRLFPVGGMTTPGAPFTITDVAWHAVLPIVTLAFYILATETRYVRASMLEVLNAQYIRTARAKGLPESRVLFTHALRNALLPVVSVLMLDGAYLFGGAIVTETIFSWPGMGRLFLEATTQGDYPVLMVTVMFLSVVIVLFNLLADVMYLYLDPRISYS